MTAEQSAAERCAMEMVGHVAALTSALGMIEQGYVFRGSVRHDIDAEQMREIAREALKAEAYR